MKWALTGGSWPFTTDPGPDVVVFFWGGPEWGFRSPDTGMLSTMLSTWTVDEGPRNLFGSISSADDSGGVTQRDTECMGGWPVHVHVSELTCFDG